MIQIPEKPPGLHTDPVRRRDVQSIPDRELTTQMRKVDAGINSQLQRSPEPAVHLHQKTLAGPAILLVFHHRDAVPTERREHADRVLDLVRIEWNTLAQDADTAGGRLFPESPVREGGDQPAAIEEHEQARAWTDDAFLNQRGKGRQAFGLLVDPPQIGFGGGVLHARSHPAARGENPRPRGFDHGRVFHPIEYRLQRAHTVDHVRPGNGNAAGFGLLNEAPLVGHVIEGFERRSCDRRVIPEVVLVPRYRVRRDVRHRHHHVDLLALHERQEKASKRVRMSIWRRVGNMTGAVPGRGRQAGGLFRSDQHRDATPSEGPRDGERRSLVAGGDKFLHGRAAPCGDAVPTDEAMEALRSRMRSIAPIPARSMRKSPTDACRPGTKDWCHSSTAAYSPLSSNASPHRPNETCRVPENAFRSRNARIPKVGACARFQASSTRGSRPAEPRSGTEDSR